MFTIYLRSDEGRPLIEEYPTREQVDRAVTELVNSYGYTFLRLEGSEEAED